MSTTEQGEVFIRVVAREPNGQIGWGSDAAVHLSERLTDVRAAIVSGAQAIAQGLPDLPSTAGWQVKEVSGTFGLSVTAEAGVILSKASTEATFEVSVTFAREDASE